MPSFLAASRAASSSRRRSTDVLTAVRPSPLPPPRGGRLERLSRQRARCPFKIREPHALRMKWVRAELWAGKTSASAAPFVAVRRRHERARTRLAGCCCGMNPPVTTGRGGFEPRRPACAARHLRPRRTASRGRRRRRVGRVRSRRAPPSRSLLDGAHLVLQRRQRRPRRHAATLPPRRPPPVDVRTPSDSLELCPGNASASIRRACPGDGSRRTSWRPPSSIVGPRSMMRQGTATTLHRSRLGTTGASRDRRRRLEYAEFG